MPNQVLEIVTFHVNAGVTDAEVLAAIPATTGFLARQPGFVSRRIGKSEDGEWLDECFWTDIASAKKAAEVFPSCAEAAPYCGLIDFDRTVMRHFTVLQSA